MAEITLTLRDTPAGGVSIQSSFKPAVGSICTPAQAQALDLHRLVVKAWPAGIDSVGAEMARLYQGGAA
jgi:hypothetical protein